MKKDLIRFTNDGLKLSPQNAVAEYVFGKIDKEQYDLYKQIYPDFDMDFYYEAFRWAKFFGLTHELSTGCLCSEESVDKINGIWNKVEIVMKLDRKDQTKILETMEAAINFAMEAVDQVKKGKK